MTRPAPAPVPLGRLPQPAEIASAALALCAPAVTGQVLRLDGGSG
jgi:NAD(P)-dependent dehydrogenase (short-subunit alcohol dehydrogenase family)